MRTVAVLYSMAFILTLVKVDLKQYFQEML